VDTYSSLIRPKDNLYDNFNIRIHGITPEDTENSPEFDSIWKDNLNAICDYFNIPLKHHRAEHDARACAEICLKCFGEGQIDDFGQLADKYRMRPGIMNCIEKSYTGPYSIRKDREKSDAREIRGDKTKINPDSLFYECIVS